MSDHLFVDVAEFVQGRVLTMAQTERGYMPLGGGPFWLARLDSQRIALLDPPPEEGRVPDAIVFELESKFGFGRAIAWPLRRSLLICQTSGRIQTSTLGSGSIAKYGALFFWRMRGRYMLEPNLSVQKKLTGSKEQIELSFSNHGIPLTMSGVKAWDPKGYPGGKLPINFLLDHLEQIRKADADYVDTGDELADALTESMQNGQQALREHRQDPEPYYEWIKKVFQGVRDAAVALRVAGRLDDATKVLEASRHGTTLEGDTDDATPEQAWDYIVKNTFIVLRDQPDQ